MGSALKCGGVARWLLCAATCVSAESPAVRASAPLSDASQAAVIDYVFVDGFEAQVDCSMDLTCPQPAAGKACLAGRISEAGSGAPMRAFVHADRSCAEGAIGGACNLQLRAYDALAYAADPAGAQPLTATSFVDGCARFRITDLTRPSLGFVAIEADDADAAPESDLHAPSVFLHPVAADQKIEDLDAVVARHDSVARWTATAGSPFGANSFADVGAILFAFAASNAPVAGVTVTRSGSTAPGQDYYFADASPPQRYLVDSLQTATGANGAALFANGPLVEYSGTGGEPAGCTWPTVLTTSIAGRVVFAAIKC